MIFDAHNDMMTFFAEKKISFKESYQKKFLKSDTRFSVFNVWIDSNKKRRVVDILSIGMKEIIRCEDIKLILKKEDFDTKEKRIQVIIGLEGIDYLENSDELYALYAYGVRLIGLTWNYTNKFATSITDSHDKGLTKEGEKIIEIMNELGMIIDISHLSDKSALEILKKSRVPVIASHSNVRNLNNHQRNLPDELIIEIAKKGGVIGVNSYPKFIAKDKKNQTIDGLIDHIDYIKKIVGIDYIGFGFDFMENLDRENLTAGDLYIKNLKNQGDIGNLIQRLENRGYSKIEIDKIAYKNMLNVFKKILGTNKYFL